MSILSQIGTVILIVFIVLLIKESNKQLEKAALEGEGFEPLTGPMETIEFTGSKDWPDSSDNLQLFEEQGISVMSEPITLILLGENHLPAKRISVNQIPFSIGRGKNNMLVLEDLCVAREHCRLVEKDGFYFLKDLGSVNKIYAGGKLHDELKLSDGKRFYVGNEEFLVEMTARTDDGRREE